VHRHGDRKRRGDGDLRAPPLAETLEVLPDILREVRLESQRLLELARGTHGVASALEDEAEIEMREGIVRRRSYSLSRR